MKYYAISKIFEGNKQLSNPFEETNLTLDEALFYLDVAQKMWIKHSGAAGVIERTEKTLIVSGYGGSKTITFEIVEQPIEIIH